MAYYPPVSFHFQVEFVNLKDYDVIKDGSFQEVSGITKTLGTKTHSEGGENRFSHRLPTRLEFGNLTMKRGMFMNTSVIDWIQKTLDNYEIKPLDVRVILLDPAGIIQAAWIFIKAYPIKWDVSSFNATDNSVVVETLEFTYQYFLKEKI